MPPVQSEWSGSRVIDGQATLLRITIVVDASGKISGSITDPPNFKITGTIYPSSKIDFTSADPDGDDIKHVGQLNSERNVITGTWSVDSVEDSGEKFELRLSDKESTAFPSDLFDKPKATAGNSQAIVDSTNASVGDSNPAQPSIIDSTKPSVGDSNPAQPPTIDSTKSSVGNSNPAQPSTIDSTKASVGNSNPPQPPIIDNIKPSVDDSKLAQPPSVSSVSSELRQTELLGGIHNTPFNDAIDIGGYPATQTIKGIVKIVLQFGDSIDGFEVSYKLDDSSVKRVHHGTTPPTQFKIKTRTITFESTEILAAVFGRWLNNSVNAIDEIGFIIFDTEKLTTRQEGPFSATNNNPKFYIPGPILAFSGYAKNGSEHRGLNSLSFLKSSTSLADVAVFDAFKPISPARPLHIYWFPDQVDCRTTGTLNTQQKGDEISLNWAAPITITTWIKYESFVDRCIFHTECNDVDPLGDDHELHYKMTSKNEFTVSTKSTPQMKLMSNPLPRSTWSFVVVVFQSPTVMLYLDDNEPKSGEWAGPKTTSREKTTVHVGYSDWGGYIRDFKVYQHALTQSQITTEFQNTRPIAIHV